MMTTGAMGKLYGATGLVGKDEMNGRINPGLEPDDDLDPAEIDKLKAGVNVAKGGGGKNDTYPDPLGNPVKMQGNTAF